MNRKGFSLIELIMVIAVLSMLALLATPNVIKLISKNKADNYNAVIDSIEEAAELYVSDHRYDLSFGGEFCKTDDTQTIESSITLEKLTEGNYIKTPVKNLCTDAGIPTTTKILIEFNCETNQFSYDIDESSSNSTLKRKTDAGGNLIDGLEGIKIKSCDELY